MTCRKVVLFVLSSIGLAVCLNQSLGFGCSCADRMKTEREDIAYQFGRANLVFEGQVESMRIGVRTIHIFQGPGLDRDEPDHYALFRVRALRVYKGRRQGTYEIMTGIGGGDCGMPFQIGAKYLIYVDEPDSKNSERFQTSICQRPSYLDDAAADLRYLRGQAPTAEDISPRQELSYTERKAKVVGSISGKVSRSDGGGFKDLDVVAWVFRDGVRRFAWWAHPATKIGPDGRYRMSLEQAGQYFIGVGNQWEYDKSAIAFYHGATRLEEATGLEVKIGEEIRNVDMTARRPALYQVRGIIQTPAGRQIPPGRIEISLGSDWDTGWRGPKLVLRPTDRVFEIPDVYPGIIQVRAKYYPEKLGDGEIWYTNVSEILVPEQKDNVVITLTKK